MKVLTLRNIRGETYLDAPWISWDLETTNTDYGDARRAENRVLCGAWQTGRSDVADGPAQGFYGDVFTYAPFRRALHDVREAGGYYIAQNCKFEAAWCLRHDIDVPSVLWADPMLFEWVLLGNNPRRQRLALEVLAPKYGAEGKDPFIAALMDGGVCPSEQPAHMLLARCIRDVESTAHVARAQLRLLRERGQLHLAAQRCLLAPVLAAIERNGITLDRNRVLTAHEEYTEKLGRLQTEWNSITRGASLRSPLKAIPLVYGIHPHKDMPARLTAKGKPRKVKDKTTGKMVPAPEPEPCLCPRCSPERQHELRAASLGFAELTNRQGPKRNKPTKSWPDGQPQLNKRTLSALARQPTLTDKQAHWLKLRSELGQVMAALSKNLDFFKGVVLERGGTFYVDILQAQTATHRLAGRGRPQVFTLWPDKPKSTMPHNMPREFKRLQTTKRGPDYYASDADGKQLEFRFAAFLGQDVRAMADIRNPDFDAHLQTLTVMLHGSLDMREYGSLLQRYRAGDKEVKWQRNDNTLCKAHTYKPLFGGERGTPREEAYYKWFREHYDGITRTCQGWLDQVVESARNDPQRYKNEHGNWCGTGSFRAPSGLIFSYDIEIKQRHNGEFIAFDRHSFKPVKPAVFNHPVQEFATGECMPIAVICLYHRVREQGLRAYLTNTVHDSADAEVHKADRPAYQAAVFQAFTHDVLDWFTNAYGITFNVPLGCEVSFGQFLGEGEHASYDTQ